MTEEEYKRNRSTAYFPLFLAITLILGLWIGTKFNTSEGNKLAAIIQDIEEHYVDELEREELVDKTIEGLLQELDPHSHYASGLENQLMKEELKGNFVGIGIRYLYFKDTVVVSELISGGPAEAAGLLPGDRFLKVGDRSVLMDSIQEKEARKLFRGKRGSILDLTVWRPTSRKLERIKITRDRIKVPSVEASTLLSGDIGYVRINNFGEKTYEEFVYELDRLEEEGMKGLILDLRNNGGGYLDAAHKICDEFLDKGQLIVYTSGQKETRKDYRATKRGRAKSLPLVVLVNEKSASASEIVAGALQDHDRGTIVGRRSFGKGLVQHSRDFKDGSGYRLTVARYYTPSGRCIQKPYGGDVVYGKDGFAKRLADGELLHADSIKVDSSKVFYTDAGRKVYGGGGIVPDLFVPLDNGEAATLIRKLEHWGIYGEYIFELADQLRGGLDKKQDPRAFVSDFELSDQQWNELHKKIQLMHFASAEQDFTHLKAYVEQDVALMLVRYLWDVKTHDLLLLDRDDDVEAAKQRLSFSSAEA